MLMNLPPIILASQSPRRSELLRGLGLEFRIVSSDAREVHNEELTAREMSQVNAYRKARAAAKRFPDALVLAADTLVYLGTVAYGKPSSMDDARRMLEQLQGRTHQVVTGVCLIQLRTHRQRMFFESTDVTMHSLGAEEIRNYLGRINPLDKAGAYAIQEHGSIIVREISGSFSNVVGLPMERLAEELELWAGENERVTPRARAKDTRSSSGLSQSNPS
jgi:septum formation protein